MLVSQTGFVDASHSEHAFACRRRVAPCLARAAELRAAIRPSLAALIRRFVAASTAQPAQWVLSFVIVFPQPRQKWVFDQPSQVFFSKKLAGIVNSLDPPLDDDDVARVRKLFEVIAKVTTEQVDKLQTIILDHAAQNVWGDIAGIYLVEEWRGSDKLIPPSWLE